ncbi:hypothetical protein QE450_003200 [Paenibacillus sp. SORGH_AS306]|nr:hypothetical protein [Paenibacillus sp. SORGH_AS_0306]MDR6112751.1 hypothetical protein [Paenibacillus sp. SORGH_AS_0338]
MKNVFRSLCVGLVFLSAVNFIMGITTVTKNISIEKDKIQVSKEVELPHENGLEV